MSGAAAYPLVIFDCDSTLTRIEGVDELARLCGRGSEVAALTQAAMEGVLSLEEVYERRLEMLRPSRTDLERLGARYVEERVAGASEVIGALTRRSIAVHIVSGGFRPAVLMLSRSLGLPDSAVHAVDLQFSGTGDYAGFDRDSPLARSGGKRIVCTGLIARYGRAAAVGDGVTDLEMQDAGADFIGFGGVALRERVRRDAARFVAAPGLDAVLPLLLP